MGIAACSVHMVNLSLVARAAIRKSIEPQLADKAEPGVGDGLRLEIRPQQISP